MKTKQHIPWAAYSPPLLCAALLLCCILPGCSPSEATPVGKDKEAELAEVNVISVSRSRVETNLDLVGTLLPVRATTIVSDVDGIIKSFPDSDRVLRYEEQGRMVSVPLTLDIGHKVSAGDVLVQIDPVDFQLALDLSTTNLELAKRNIEELHAWKRAEEVEQLEAAMEEAQASHVLAQKDLKRGKQLLGERTISQSEYDLAVMTESKAAAALKRTNAALKMAKAGPTVQQAAVAEAAFKTAQAEVALRQEKLDKTTIHAPYDAVISDRYVAIGDRVTAMPRVEIMQIIDQQALFAQVCVPQRYQGRIKLGDMAAVTAESTNGSIPARVEFINAKVDPETRTFRVRLVIDNRGDIFKAGGFVSVSLPMASLADVVAVPLSAVTFSLGCPAVFVYDNGQVKKTPVKLGIASREMYEVRGGLSQGQMVVVGDTLLLADGMRVKRAADKRTSKTAGRPVGEAKR